MTPSSNASAEAFFASLPVSTPRRPTNSIPTSTPTPSLSSRREETQQTPPVPLQSSTSPAVTAAPASVTNSPATNNPEAADEKQQRWSPDEVLKLIAWVEENYLSTQGSAADWSRDFVAANVVPRKRAPTVVKKWLKLKDSFSKARLKMNASGWGVDDVSTDGSIKSKIEKICPHYFRLEPLLGSRRNISTPGGNDDSSLGLNSEWLRVARTLGEPRTRDGEDEDGNQIEHISEPTDVSLAQAALTPDEDHHDAAVANITQDSDIVPVSGQGNEGSGRDSAIASGQSASLPSSMISIRGRKTKANDGNQESSEEILSGLALQPIKKKSKGRSNTVAEILTNVHSSRLDFQSQLREDGLKKFVSEFAETKSQNVLKNDMSREELNWKMKQAHDEYELKKQAQSEQRNHDSRQLELFAKKEAEASEHRKEELRLKEMDIVSNNAYRSEELQIRRLEAENEKLRLQLELEKLRQSRNE